MRAVTTGCCSRGIEPDREDGPEAGLAAGFEGLDDDHPPAAARASIPVFIVPTIFGAIARLARRSWVGDGEEPAGQCNVVGPVGIGEEAVVTDAMKSIGQDMDQEAADELVGVERHKLIASVAFGPVILPFESDALAGEGDEPAVGNSSAVCVAGKIGEDGVGSAKRSLGIDDPFDLAQCGEEGLFKELKKRLLERALGAELTEHLGYEKGAPAGRGSGNSRNGYSSKTVIGDDGAIEIAVPRDRNSTFEPQLVPKGQTRLDGFDDRIISLYARGLSVREIQSHLMEIYGVAVSPDLISRVTDAVLEEVREWQNRPLDPLYPMIFFDALRVKIRDEGLVRNKAVYVALALNSEGEKEVLGLWIEQTEGAKFWLKVMNELKTRGVGDVLIAVVDGLKGFPEAIGAVFPLTTVQTCIIHLIRNSLAFVSWKDRKLIMPDLKAIYRAETAEAAAVELDRFEVEWGQRYPAIGQAWRRAWEHVVPLFAFPPAIRKMIYTTNAVESLHRSLRKIIKTRGSFPTDEAALKLLFLAIRNAGVHWRRPING